MKRIYSAADILHTLRAIKSLELDSNGCLEVGFFGASCAEEKCSISEFDSDTFTRDLLVDIEYHMSPEEEDEKEEAEKAKID
jgi:hypothetical protein